MRFAGGAVLPLVATGLAVLSAAAVAAAVWLRGPEADGRVSATLSVTEALGGSPEGFERAAPGRALVFPEDHGPHPTFRTEWWYLTGNLEGSGGRPFGFQLTFFRNGLSPDRVDSPSAWRTDQAWMAHFAVTDVDGASHHAFERFARGAAGLAGARASPFRVWLEDWTVASVGDALFPLEVRAEEGDVLLELVLEAEKEMVLQGDAGYSRKGTDPGQASYYYSYTRLTARGRVRTGGDTVEVGGLAWMDREWSTSVLSEGQVGWDWFALQLTDGAELVFYQLRRSDGSTDPFSRGLYVRPDASTLSLSPGDWSLEVLDRWSSPVDGTLYPSRWRVRIPALGLELDVRSRVPDQELDLGFRYWEGAVAVEGRTADGSVEGWGYAELTGYHGASPRTDREGGR